MWRRRRERNDLAVALYFELANRVARCCIDFDDPWSGYWQEAAAHSGDIGSGNVQLIARRFGAALRPGRDALLALSGLVTGWSDIDAKALETLDPQKRRTDGSLRDYREKLIDADPSTLAVRGNEYGVTGPRSLKRRSEARGVCMESAGNCKLIPNGAIPGTPADERTGRP